MTNTNTPSRPEKRYEVPELTSGQKFAAAAIVVVIIIVLIRWGSKAGTVIAPAASGVASSVAGSMSVADIASMLR